MNPEDPRLAVLRERYRALNEKAIQLEIEMLAIERQMRRLQIRRVQ